jgi:alpha-L-fucosidase
VRFRSWCWFSVFALGGLAAAALAAPASSVSGTGAAAGGPYVPTAANLESRRWFQDAKLGLFVHWGVYSVLADGEWVMNQQKLSVDDYEKLPPLFNPTQFDAVEWVALAKAAGMKYITITAKHHDGFAMFDSKITDWDIVDRTPYKQDPLKRLADEARKQGLRLFFYYSQLDWHHPDYYPRGGTGRESGRPERGAWPKYLDFMNGQLTELLTRYGPVGGIWFDGWWDRRDADWQLGRTYGLIHKLQPGALVGSNHHQAPRPGEDFQMFEKDLPGQNKGGFSGDAKVGALPLETCDTINNSWGFTLKDKSVKSARELVAELVRAAGLGANLLLNVGPMSNGKIPPEFVDRLRAVGAWLDRHGDSIYGTRAGPVPPRPWGATTRKGNVVFVHVLDWPDQALALPALGPVTRARVLVGGAPVAFSETSGGLVLQIPKDARDPIDTVIAIDLAEHP